MVFKYPPFNSSNLLMRVARGGPPLRRGAHGSAVGLLQAALVQVGRKLPHSVSAKGIADGYFGSETEGAVLAYQGARPPLQVDGVVGKNTIARLDAELSKAAPATVVPTAKPKPLPSTPEYEVGQGDPPFTPDPGAGQWRSRPAQTTYEVLKYQIMAILPAASAAIGKEAADHMRHYLNGSGRDYRINLEGMPRDVSTAQNRFRHEVSQARKLVEQLPAGTHQIRSKRVNFDYNYKAETKNWFFAIGGYLVWGDGVANVVTSSSGDTYTLDFNYHFFDRYNWDGGKKVELFGVTITDAFMGEFHRQGLAREYNCKAVASRRFQWSKGSQIPSHQYQAPAAGGQ